MNLVFLGPPGAGKGTQAKRVSCSHSWPHISTGDLLREAVAEGSELGTQAKPLMDEGRLIPDDLICGMVAERLSQDDCREGWLLDGFPRTQVQAVALAGTLAEIESLMDSCIYFHVDFDVVTERLAGRLTCSDCGALFHRTFNPPKHEGACDACEGALFQRSDDNEESVRKRLSVYESSTRELVDHYRDAGLLVQINAQGTPDEVEDRVEAVLTGL